jgi:hypothetical protein
VAAGRGLFQNDEPCLLKVAHDALSGDGGHVFIGAVDALAALEPQRERNRVGEVARVGRDARP